jgi:pyruvate dehydrogenase E2 component (dihydrolipoamide acetyltransferase)
MDVRLPHLGEGADSGTVVNVLVKRGDRIAKDQPLLELENEKAVATIPSTAAGVVGEIYVKAGDKVSVGQKILSLAGSEAAGPTAAQAPKARARGPGPEEQHEEPAASEEPETPPSAAEPSSPPAASPAIRRLARDLGIDLSRVRGTARGGRIVMGDLRAYIARLQKLAAQPRGGAGTSAASRPSAERIDFAKWGSVDRKPLSPLREVIARRMLDNWNTIPHVTQLDQAEITGLLGLRKKHLAAYEKEGARLTVTSFVLKAAVETLKLHPAFNCSLDPVTQEIVIKNYYHLGIAVDTEAGLIVPVIRDADKKSLLELSKELEALAARARDRKVTGEELKGGTFTISNQGGIGGGHFTPIINKPEVAILGLGRGAMQAAVRNRKIEPRMMLPLALSYDHRVIDGAQAARFIVDLVKAIEEFPEQSVALR